MVGLDGRPAVPAVLPGPELRSNRAHPAADLRLRTAVLLGDMPSGRIPGPCRLPEAQLRTHRRQAQGGKAQGDERQRPEACGRKALRRQGVRLQERAYGSALRGARIRARVRVHLAAVPARADSPLQCLRQDDPCGRRTVRSGRGRSASRNYRRRHLRGNHLPRMEARTRILQHDLPRRDDAQPRITLLAVQACNRREQVHRMRQML